jgi:hypothetical protein
MNIRIASIGALALMASTSFATSALFDFESEALSNTVRGFSMTDNGITATFLDPGADSWIVDLGSSAPTGWQSRTFLPAVFTTQQQTVNFSTALAFLQIEGGDFFSDDDEVHIRAYSGLNGTGSLMASFDGTYDVSKGIPGDVIVASVFNAAGFQSIVFWEDGQTGQNDFYFDNMAVRAVPEPATLIALGAGLAALARRRRS